jgi:hypothetical protein
MGRSDDWVKFTLDLPVNREPGTTSSYCSGGVIVLGRLVEKRSNRKQNGRSDAQRDAETCTDLRRSDTSQPQAGRSVPSGRTFRLPERVRHMRRDRVALKAHEVVAKEKDLE